MNKKPIAFFVILFISCSQISNSLVAINQYNNKDKFLANSCPGPFPTEEESIELTIFPIDLDSLFYNDNETMQNYILNNIGNWSTIWPVTPWNGHFHSTHVEGADKWYLYSYRRLPVRAIHNGELDELSILNVSIINYDSQELVSDLGLTYNIGNDFSIQYSHIDLLKPIYDEIQVNGTYSFTENEIIGYNHNWSDHFCLDFHTAFKYHDICPLQLLSTELKSDLLNYYSLVYDKAKASGRYPESNICNNHTCEIEDTVWGVWEYQNGSYDDEYYGNPELVDPLGVWTIFNRNFTNPETFYREQPVPGENLTANVIGMIADGFPEEITEYKKLDHCPLKLIEGNYEIGIFEITNYFPNDWGPSDTSVFAKFSIAKHSTGASDDILTLEFFADLVSAQIGFTNNNLTLKRYYHYTPYVLTSPWLGKIAEQALYFLLGFTILTIIIVIPVVVIVRKRKKRKAQV